MPFEPNNEDDSQEQNRLGQEHVSGQQSVSQEDSPLFNLDNIPDDEEDSEDGVLGEELFVTAKKAIPITPALSEEELKELLAPVKEPHPAMAELSKEELEELLAPTARHELTDEGLFSEDEEEEDEFISSVMSEVSEYDDPELKALAKEIAELERQEHEQRAEKTKKKSKKKQKRKH